MACSAGDHPDVLRRSVLTVNASKRRLETSERNAKRQASRQSCQQLQFCPCCVCFVVVSFCFVVVSFCLSFSRAAFRRDRAGHRPFPDIILIPVDM